MYEVRDILVHELQQKNDIRIHTLKESIQKTGLCFVLGAGVSRSVGFPEWSELLAQAVGTVLYTFDGKNKTDKSKELLMEDILHEALNKDADKFRQGSRGGYRNALERTNLLELAEYLLNYYTIALSYDNPEVKRAVAEKQLLTTIRSCMHKTEQELNDLYWSKKYRTSTLHAVAESIKKAYGTDRNKQIVITYNYDNLLEYCLGRDVAVCPEGSIKTISYKGCREKNEQKQREYRQIEEHKINICHIHGYFDVTNYNNDCSGLILSESSYHDAEYEEYSWINTFQANAMSNHTCLLVGFSGEDYNFRRLVRKNKDMGIYILFAVDDIVTGVFSKKYSSLEGMALKKVIAGQLKDKHASLYEKLMITFLIYSKTLYWEEQGVYPIWTTLEELPDIIEKLY